MRALRHPAALAPLAPLAALALLLAACGTATYGTGGSTSPTATSGTSPAISVNCGTPQATVCTKTVLVAGSKRLVLADAAGKTLYYFDPDSATKIACTGSCASVWPPLAASGGSPTAVAGVSGMLGVLNGGNGAQVLYNGHPLYTYARDAGIADATGDGVGGKWHVATPALAEGSTPTGKYGY